MKYLTCYIIRKSSNYNLAQILVSKIKIVGEFNSLRMMNTVRNSLSQKREKGVFQIMMNLNRYKLKSALSSIMKRKLK